MENEKFAQRMKELRDRSGLSLAKVARAVTATGATISTPYLSKIEHGQRPALDKLEALAAFYGVDFHELRRLAGYGLPSITKLIVNTPDGSKLGSSLGGQTLIRLKKDASNIDVPEEEGLLARLHWAVECVLNDRFFTDADYFRERLYDGTLGTSDQITLVEIWQRRNRDEGLRLMTDNDLRLCVEINGKNIASEQQSK